MNQRSALWDTFGAASATMVAAVTGFFFWMIATGRAGFTGIGAAAIIVSGALFAATIGKGGLDYRLTQVLSTSPKPRATIARALVWIGASTACVAAGYAALTDVGLRGFVQILIIGEITAIGIVADAGNLSRGAGMLGAWRAAAHGLLRIVLLIAFPLVGAEGILLAWELSGAVNLLAVFHLYMAFPRAHGTTFPGQPARAADFVTRFSSHALILSPGLLFPWIISTRSSAATAGVFYILWMIVALLHAVPNGLSQSLPAYAGSTDVTRGLLRRALLLTAGACLAFVTAGPWLLALLGGAELASSYFLLVGFAAVAVGSCFSSACIARLRAREQEKRLLALGAAFAGTSLIVAWVTIPAFGLPGVLLGWALAHAIFWIHHAIPNEGAAPHV